MADEPTPAQRRQRLDAIEKARAENTVTWQALARKQKAVDDKTSTKEEKKTAKDQPQGKRGREK